MKRSESIAGIAAALGVFRNRVKTIKADSVGSDGRDFWAYSELPDVFETIRPWLKAAKLVVWQDTKSDGSLEGAMTVLIHEDSGEFIETEWLFFPAGRDAQSAGIAVTKARRYSLYGALGLAHKDTDGLAEAARAQAEAPTAPPAQQAEVAPKARTSGSSTSRQGAKQEEGLGYRPSKARRLSRKLGLTKDAFLELAKSVIGERKLTRDMTRDQADAVIAELEARMAAKGAERS